MSDDNAFPRLLAILSDWTASGHQIGAQVFISRDGQTLADFAVGQSRPGVDMTSDTLMLWLSASKPFAGVALALLREKGLLDFADPVAKFIPEFAAEGKESITLTHFLTHTAGLRFIETGWPETAWDQIIATLCAAKIEKDWPIGQKAGYSPFASWFLLAEVVRRIDGRLYEGYVRDEIFLPLGMTDSWFAMPSMTYREYGDRIGLLMNTQKKPMEPSGNDTEAAATNCRPSGGGRGPARELGTFYEMLLTEGQIPSPSRLRKSEESASQRLRDRILSPESVRLLTTPHRVGMFDHTFRHVMDWGLGFIVNSAGHGVETIPYGYGPKSSRQAFGHGGAQSTCAFADPERGLVVVIVFNGMPGEPAHHRRLKATLAAMEADLEVI